MPIQTKLLLALVMSLIAVIGVGTFALVQMAKITSESNRISNYAVPSLIIANQIGATLSDYRTLQADHIASITDSDSQRIEKKLQATESRMNELLNTFDGIIDGDNQATFGQFRQNWPKFVDRTHAELLPPSNARNYTRAFLVFNALDVNYSRLQAEIADLISLTRADNRATQTAISDTLNISQILIISITILFALAIIAGWFFTAAPIRRGIIRLMGTTEAIGRGDLQAPVAVTGGDELATLASALYRMQQALSTARTDLETRQAALVQQAAELAHALADLQHANESRDQLSSAIRALTSPVLPVMRGVLVMPLIGNIDTQRANEMNEVLLSAIQRERAHTVIMDITGVPLVDTDVAATLLRVAQAAQMLGAKMVLVGMRPELAQTIVGLGVNLSHFVTRSDLESGIRYAAGRA